MHCRGTTLSTSTAVLHVCTPGSICFSRANARFPFPVFYTAPRTSNMCVNPFTTAVPFWGQTSQISNSFVPNRTAVLLSKRTPFELAEAEFYDSYPTAATGSRVCRGLLTTYSIKWLTHTAVNETNRTNPKPNPEPIKATLTLTEANQTKGRICIK